MASLVRPLLQLLGELSGLEAVYLTSIDWEAAEQHIEFASNSDPDWRVEEDQTVAWQDTLCELSLAEGSGWNTDVQGTWGHRRAAVDLAISSYVSVPVRLSGDAVPFGTLCGASPRTVVADERVVSVMVLFSRMIATALQRDAALRVASARADYAEARLAGRIAFAAQVEHALKSPLAVIAGWAETMASRPDQEVQEAGLDAILRTSARMSVQVSDLLAEARSAIGAAPAETVDLVAVAREVAAMVTTHPYAVTGAGEVSTDPIAVAVLVEHLVENAVAHTPSDTPIRVLVSERQLVVEDDGPGLPDRDDLFEAFVSADPDNPGTGLGLHIVGQITERLGIDLEVGASDSGGARFTLRFPEDD